VRSFAAAARESPRVYARQICRAAALFLVFAPSLIGCRATPPHLPAARIDQGLSAPIFISALQASCVPPVNWKPDPLKQSATHTHQVWISPGGNTAYGVINFRLPLPVGHELALWGFLNEMRTTEGEATLLEKGWDPNLGTLRFVAEGGKYTVRTNLFVHGFTGWAVYAGTLRAFPVNQNELDLAERARQNTVVGPIH
jgi:hypothetical protein